MSGSKLSKNLNAGDDQPLALTVHGVPVPGQAMAQPQRTGRGRWTMFAVLLACAAPVVASYVTYYFIRPEARRVFGELVDPQRPLPALAGPWPAPGRPLGKSLISLVWQTRQA